jgi:hypothetical protein
MGRLKSNRNALLVGINYIGTQNELNGCINDTESLKIKLKELKFNNINILTDNTPLKPTKDNILSQLQKLLVESNEGDILFFAYSGHGSSTIDRSGDEADGLDELLVPCDLNPISDDLLKYVIKKYIKKNVILYALFDCCHSGTIVDLKYQYFDSVNYDKFTINEKVEELNNNIIIISGCMDNQTSADAYINKKFQGAMTWSFLEACKNNPNISLNNLLINMRELLKKSDYTQIPQLSSNKRIDINKNCFFKKVG